jgi:TRAP-type uncharacterized transport system substrate-binding protein
MLGFGRRHLLVKLAALLCIFGIISLALSYFIPAPPTKITMATAFRGASFDFYGRLYKEKFAQAHVNLDLRETNGAIENLRLLKDPNSGVQIGFMTGGVSDGEHSPGLLSLGTIDYLVVWLFYNSTTPLEQFSQFQGKRIAVGPVGSGTRFTAEQILGKAGINSENSTLMPLAGNAAVDALNDKKVDVAFILGGPDTPTVQALLVNPSVRLMSFPRAEAFTRIFPNLVRLELPQGVFDITRNIPSADVTLIATTNRVLVRSDLHPAIVNLLLETMQQVHGRAGIFQRAGDFPRPTDTDYPVAASAIDFYKNGPSFLERHLPLWLAVHAQRAIAVIVTFVAVGFPLLHYLPVLYKWNMRRRLLDWYRQLKSLEASIDTNPSKENLIEKQAEVERIERAVSRTRFPLSFTDQLYDLRGHIDIVRRRLTPAGGPAFSRKRKSA